MQVTYRHALIVAAVVVPVVAYLAAVGRVAERKRAQRVADAGAPLPLRSESPPPAFSTPPRLPKERLYARTIIGKSLAEVNKVLGAPRVVDDVAMFTVAGVSVTVCFEGGRAIWYDAWMPGAWPEDVAAWMAADGAERPFVRDAATMWPRLWDATAKAAYDKRQATVRPEKQPEEATPPPGWTLRADADVDKARAMDVASRLIAECTRASGETVFWGQVAQVQVDLTDIEGWFWTIGVSFPDRAGLHDGQTLWYRLRKDLERFYAMEDISAELCGLIDKDAMFSRRL